MISYFIGKWIRLILQDSLVVPRSSNTEFFMVIIADHYCDTCNRHMLVTTKEKKLREEIVLF
jgi:hypothetical protein